MHNVILLGLIIGAIVGLLAFAFGINTFQALIFCIIGEAQGIASLLIIKKHNFKQ